jgi:hypothetical protein
MTFNLLSPPYNAYILTQTLMTLPKEMMIAEPVPVAHACNPNYLGC